MLKDRSTDVLRVIREIEGSESVEAITRAFLSFVRHFGFTSLYIGQLVNPLNVPSDKIMVVSTWPEELQHRRMTDHASIHDPIVKCALRSKKPFYWSTAYEYASRLGRAVMDQARDYNVNDGIMFPMHSFESVPGGVSLGGDTFDLGPEDIAAIELVARHCYYSLERLLGPFPYQIEVELSHRELEAVQFAAAGKTNWEISVILGIPESSVREALRRANQKLGAVNRAHAVATAIAKNLILA